MKYYFTLQCQRLLRKLSELGIHLVVGLVLSVVIFIFISLVLFAKLDYAEWIYCILAIVNILQLGHDSRTALPKQIFSKRTYLTIRTLENSLLALPFVMFMFYKWAFIEGVVLLFVCMLLALFDFKHKVSSVIPTPFRKWPFEFIAGFRKSILILPIIGLMLYHSVAVHNFNLGMASLALLFAVSFSYYIKPESGYFVWVHKAEAKQFLIQKCKTALWCVTLFSLPVLLVLALGYPERLFAIGIGQLIGYLFIMSIVLAKYSAYPNEIGLPQALLYAISLWFPPLLFLAIPLFYKQAVKKLNPILS